MQHKSRQYRAFLWTTITLFVMAFSPSVGRAEETPALRALFIACEEFISQPSMAPSSSNNIELVSRAFASGSALPDRLVIEDGTISSYESLERAIAQAFDGATEDDISLFYISTHGVYDPQRPEQDATLLLSDGTNEYALSADELRGLLDTVPGTKFLILDACNSGTFIDKGVRVDSMSSGVHAFSSPDYKVLTSCGGDEKSWYWDAQYQDGKYGSSYFALMLSHALSARSQYPADTDYDGRVTLDELYEYLVRTQPSSTAQVYPQKDADFVVFTAAESVTLPSPAVRDITFNQTVLTMDEPEITFSFTVTQPVRIQYQLVYARNGEWDWANAALYDDEMLSGDSSGYLMPGRIERSLSLGSINAESNGFALLQLITIGDQGPEIHEGRLLCVQPIVGDPQLTIYAGASFSLRRGLEMPIAIKSDFPISLTVGIYTTQGELVRHLAVQASTRPTNAVDGEATYLYWDGRDKYGDLVSVGSYQIRAWTTVGYNRYETALDNIFVRDKSLPVQLTPIG